MRRIWKQIEKLTVWLFVNTNRIMWIFLTPFIGFFVILLGLGLLWIMLCFPFTGLFNGVLRHILYGRSIKKMFENGTN